MIFQWWFFVANFFGWKYSATWVGVWDVIFLVAVLVLISTLHVCWNNAGFCVCGWCTLARNILLRLKYFFEENFFQKISNTYIAKKRNFKNLKKMPLSHTAPKKPSRTKSKKKAKETDVLEQVQNLSISSQKSTTNRPKAKRRSSRKKVRWRSCFKFFFFCLFFILFSRCL